MTMYPLITAEQYAAEASREGNDMSAQKQAGQAEAHPAAAPAGEQERDFVLEVAAQIADEFAEMFRTEPPFCDNFWAGCNIAKAIRALKDASAPKIGGTLDDPPLAPAGRA